MVAIMAKRRGRKPKPVDEVRREVIRVVANMDERSIIERAAELSGFSLSEYCRRVLLPHARRIIARSGE